MRSGWLIYNPSAGRFPAGPLLERARDVLIDAGWDLQVVTSTRLEELADSARRAVDAGSQAVFVAGGDGSVGAVAPVLAGTQTALGVLPAGTANVWAQELGLPRLTWGHPLALEAAAARLANGRTRLVDLGLVDGHTFLLWAGIGLDGKIVNSLEPRARWEKAFAAAHYATLAAWESLDWQGVDLRVSALGQNWEGRFLLAVASNIRIYAGGYLELSPDAKIDDGLLEFWLLRGRSIRDAVARAAEILLGRHEDTPEVVHFRAAQAVFEAQAPLPMQFDGEPGVLDAPIEFAVRSKVLRVLVPEGGWPELFSSEDEAAGHRPKP